MEKKEEFFELHEKILGLRTEIINSVTKAIRSEVGDGDLDDYLIVWNQLQNIASPVIEKILKRVFHGAKISLAKSKSTYPDIKMEWKDFKIAIDIKSNESSKEPWYDIARLDTIIKSRLEKYDEEYELVVKYDSKTKKLLKMFFETLRDTVGIRKECEGVKYRPYDGKLRPKSWKDFNERKTYWPTKEVFLLGIGRSKRNRQETLMKGFIEDLSEDEKKRLKEGLFS